MKTFLLILALAGAIRADYISESITSTAKGSGMLYTNQNSPFAIGDDQKQHRLHTDNNGNLYSTSSGSTTTTYVSDTATAAILNSVICLTCTPRALFTTEVRFRNVSYTSSPGSVTYASGVFGSTYFFLTPAAKTRVTLTQAATNNRTARFVMTKSATPPINTATVFQELAPGAVVILDDDGGTFLHIWKPLIVPNQLPIVIRYEGENPWTGTSY